MSHPSIEQARALCGFKDEPAPARVFGDTFEYLGTHRRDDEVTGSDECRCKLHREWAARSRAFVNSVNIRVVRR